MSLASRWALVCSSGCVSIIGVACILPDSEIQVYSLDQNGNPVRFVYGIPLTPEASGACADPEAPEPECPLPSQAPLPPFLDPDADDEYRFCICAEPKLDLNRLKSFSLFAEDQDEVDGKPTDEIKAAALLDWNPVLDDPAFDYVAYRSYVDPSSKLPLSTSDYESDIIGRPRPYARVLLLSKSVSDTTFDLCNGSGGVLEPGHHTISFMVTDRPWFTTENGVTFDGVPDIAAGASYDIQSFVFYCFEEVECQTQCAEPQLPP